MLCTTITFGLLFEYLTRDSEHCFDLSGLISAVDVTDIYSRQYAIYAREGVFAFDL